jgi:hypothetical protein
VADLERGTFSNARAIRKNFPRSFTQMTYPAVAAVKIPGVSDIKMAHELG